MELNYEKDTILLMKLLAYNIESLKYWNPQWGENPEESYGQPWVDIDLSEQELADVGIPLTRARLLRSGICAKQGMKPSDFITTETVEHFGEQIVINHNHVTFPALFWIESIIDRIENNQKQINPELIKIDLDDNNSLSLNGITGEFMYNKTKGTLTLRSRKMKFLRALMKSKTRSMTYDEMVKLLFNDTEYNKAKHAKALSDVLNDLKRDLGILPKTEESNQDCFKNETKTGYRLSLSD